MRLRELILATLVVGMSASLAAGQAVGGAGAGEAAGAGETAPGNVESMTMTPEQIRDYLTKARVQRLGLERDQVSAEIEEGLLFNPAQISMSLKLLKASPKNTWADNAKRISEAYALVAPRFGKAYKLHQAGKHAEVIAALKPTISQRDTTYFAAAKSFLLAESMVGAGQLEDAVETYTDLVKNMPDRFSFSALALLRAAEVYERMHRRYYAMSLYNLWVDSFGLLDEETARKLIAKADAIQADYKDPLKTIAGKMGQVKTYLDKSDSGRANQQKQKEIIEQLDDIIALAEEQAQQGQSKGQGKGQKQGKKPGEGKGKGQGKKKGPASGIGIPSSPATASRLVGGDSPRPKGLSDIRPSDPSDDWGRLPPRERAKLLETFKETMPERYREMIRDYYERLGKGETR